VHPGDHLIVSVKNNLPQPAAASAIQMSTNAPLVCGASNTDASSVNIHYHGTNTSPTSHSDEVIHTLINSGQTFNYNIAFPADEPPGLYTSTGSLKSLCGAGLPEPVLIVRDQTVAGNPMPGGAVPAWDLTLNYAPIAYPALIPAVIRMQPSQQEF
jgi:hypothetical protein